MIPKVGGPYFHWRCLWGGVLNSVLFAGDKQGWREVQGYAVA